MKTEHRIYAGLVVLLLLGGAVYVTGQNKKEQGQKHSAAAATADLPTIGVPKDDLDKVTKVEVTSLDKDDKKKQLKVVLEKKGEDWDLTAPISVKANAAYVKSLLDS